MEESMFNITKVTPRKCKFKIVLEEGEEEVELKGKVTGWQKDMSLYCIDSMYKGETMFNMMVPMSKVEIIRD